LKVRVHHVSWGRRALLFVCWWAGLMLAWLLFTLTLQPIEVLAGVIAAAIGATVAELVRVQDLKAFRPRLRWILRAWVLPARVLSDCGTVLMALFRRVFRGVPIEGAFRAVPFDSGEDDPYGAARRALVTVAISVTPNTYVVGIDKQHDCLLVHQLVPAPRDRATQDVLGRL
jgi:multisubunit Na+/H+ antiporter MnhE subunit